MVRPAGAGPAEQFRARAEQFERQAEKAQAAGRSQEADEAKANAKQWREWPRPPPTR
ncbi:conserved alanine and arginine rich domain protein [Mycobacterium xenopi 4042]|uniref:Conserved alanine and arginine rich domain protein n=1 Tax=Mycobacterium xenopi 4042 TaxID=1299334 RepID=X8CDK5_MYCXE|nr:conserved alanine and arginine rich domain protein [Mycobacterium xenopi 4042]